MANNKKLLTIAIPTYNRAAYLDLCLANIFVQIAGFEEEVEVYISDNCSPDGTGAVVAKYQERGCRLTYSRNPRNIGSTANFIKCFTAASGKYALIFSDDDILVDGALAKIMALLRGGTYGVVALSAYGFKDAYIPRSVTDCRALVYKDCREFFDRTHVFMTYVSGNIINKELVPADIPLDLFAKTNLSQLTWLIPTALAAPVNVYLTGNLVAGKENNSGGYRLCSVFGDTIEEIFKYFIARGADPACFEAVRSKMLTDFFPGNLVAARSNGRFEEEDSFKTLKPIYGGDLRFWLFVVPVIKLPLPLAKVWRKLMSGFLKVFRILFVRETGEELAL